MARVEEEGEQRGHAGTRAPMTADPSGGTALASYYKIFKILEYLDF